MRLQGRSPATLKCRHGTKWVLYSCGPFARVAKPAARTSCATAGRDLAKRPYLALGSVPELRL